MPKPKTGQVGAKPADMCWCKHRKMVHGVPALCHACYLENRDASEHPFAQKLKVAA